jgi:hypothetical protein
MWKDWKGKRHILVLLCKWHKDIPKWVHSEDDDYVEKIL